MSTTPIGTTPPVEPVDPELRERYRRDAERQRESRRATSAARAAEVEPSPTPSGPIKVIAALVAGILVLLAGMTMIGPMLRQDETTERALPAGLSSLEVRNDVGDVRVRAADPGEEPSVIRTDEFGLIRGESSIETSGRSATLTANCPEVVLGTVCRTDWVVVVPEGTHVRVSQGVGSVALEGLAGDVDVEAGVGDVSATEMTSAEMGVDLGVGDITIESVEPPDRVGAHLGVGDVTVRVPDEVSYRVDARGQGASNQLGNDPTASRRIIAEVGVGGLTIQPS